MRNIAFVVSTLRKTGPTNQLYYLIKFLDRNVYRPIVITLSHERDCSKWGDFQALGVELHSLGLSRIVGLVLSANRVANLVRSLRVDVVHTQGIRADIIASRLPKDLKTIVTLRTNLSCDYPAKFGRIVGRLMINRHLTALASVDKIIACSQELSLSCQANYNMPTSFIHNGVDDTLFFNVSEHEKKEIRYNCSLPEKAVIFITAGSLIHGKDVKTTIGAFIRSSIAEIGGVLLVAGAGVESDKLQALAKNHDNIIFLGDIPNIKVYLQASDFFVSTSLSEGLPNVVLEALACGLPCLLSNIVAHKEILAFEQNAGRLFPVGNVEELALLINSIVKKNYHSMSRATCRIMHDHLNARQMSQKYQQVYRNLIND